MGGKTSGLCFTTGDGFSPCPINAFSSCRESVVGLFLGGELRLASATTIPIRSTPRAATVRPKRTRRRLSAAIEADTDPL